MSSLSEYVAEQGMSILAVLFFLIASFWPVIEMIMRHIERRTVKVIKCTENPFGEKPCLCPACTNKRDRLRAIEEEIILMGRRAKALNDSKRKRI